MSLYYTERNGRAKSWLLDDCSYNYNHSSYNDQNEIQQLLAEYNIIINNLNRLRAISNEEIDSITGVNLNGE